MGMDFSFTGREEDSQEKLCVLVLKDKDSNMIDAIPTPGKGGKATKHLVTEVCRFLNALGHHEVVLKGDGEPAIVALQNRISITGTWTRYS